MCSGRCGVASPGRRTGVPARYSAANRPISSCVSAHAVETTMASRRDAVLFVLLSVAWGSGFVAVKIGQKFFPPVLYAALCFDVTALGLFACVLVDRDQWRPRTRWSMARRRRGLPVYRHDLQRVLFRRAARRTRRCRCDHPEFHPAHHRRPHARSGPRPPVHTRRSRWAVRRPVRGRTHRPSDPGDRRDGRPQPPAYPRGSRQ